MCSDNRPCYIYSRYVALLPVRLFLISATAQPSRLCVLTFGNTLFHDVIVVDIHSHGRL